MIAFTRAKIPVLAIGMGIAAVLSGAAAWGLVAMSAPEIVVLDYGSGNLRSAQRALEQVGAQVVVTADRDAALAADVIIIIAGCSGVGAYAACMQGVACGRRSKDSRYPIGRW